MPRWEDAHTIGSVIRVRKAIGDFLILQVVRDSAAPALTVDDAAIGAAVVGAARLGGLLLCPRAARRSPRTRTRSRPVWSAATSASCRSTAQPGSNTPCPIYRTLDRLAAIDLAAL